MSDLKFHVFTKPWNLDIPALGKHIAALGFDGIELPVRGGFAVNPDNQAKELVRAARILSDFGLTIASIAGPTDEVTIATCAEAGIPLIRICVEIRTGETYDEAVTRHRRSFDLVVPHLDRYGVALGIQNHYGQYVCDAMGLRNLTHTYDPRHVAIVWDAAHNALQGEDPDLALDIVWKQLSMVNLKNAIWQRTNGPEAEYATWKPYWTSGRHGLASWPCVATLLKKREYNGPICLTAEYDDPGSVDRLIAEDLAFAKQLFAE